MGKIIKLKSCCRLAISGTQQLIKGLDFITLKTREYTLMWENLAVFGNLSLTLIYVELSSDLLPDFKICTEFLAILCFRKYEWV